MFVSVAVFDKVTSGVVHWSPDVVAELAVKTWPFVPTDRTDRVLSAEAERMSPLAFKSVFCIFLKF